MLDFNLLGSSLTDLNRSDLVQFQITVNLLTLPSTIINKLAQTSDNFERQRIKNLENS